MEKSQMKNIVVLRNLPSNLIEEAFVIVKSKKTAKSLEYIDKKDKLSVKEKGTSNYIIREAESVLSSYVNGVEKKDNKQESITINKKYKRLKIYSFVVTFVLFVMLFSGLFYRKRKIFHRYARNVFLWHDKDFQKLQIDCATMCKKR